MNCKLCGKQNLQFIPATMARWVVAPVIVNAKLPHQTRPWLTLYWSSIFCMCCLWLEACPSFGWARGSSWALSGIHGFVIYILARLYWSWWNLWWVSFARWQHGKIACARLKPAAVLFSIGSIASCFTMYRKACWQRFISYLPVWLRWLSNGCRPWAEIAGYDDETSEWSSVSSAPGVSISSILGSKVSSSNAVSPSMKGWSCAFRLKKS